MVPRVWLLWHREADGLVPRLGFDAASAAQDGVIEARAIGERDLMLISTRGAATLLETLARRFPPTAALSAPEAVS